VRFVADGFNAVIEHASYLLEICGHRNNVYARGDADAASGGGSCEVLVIGVPVDDGPFCRLVAIIDS